MPVAIALKRAITGLLPAIQASSRAGNLESLNKARAGGDRKPLWVWDWVATRELWKAPAWVCFPADDQAR